MRKKKGNMERREKERRKRKSKEKMRTKRNKGKKEKKRKQRRKQKKEGKRTSVLKHCMKISHIIKKNKMFSEHKWEHLVALSTTDDTL